MEPETGVEAHPLSVHAGWMRALATSLLADPSAADDVVQDSCLAAIRHPPDEARPLEPWLSRVVRNFAWRRRRSDSRRTDHEQHARVPESPLSPAETVERLELSRDLVDLVQALEEPYRTTVFLHYFEGRTSAEIARSEGVPAGTVRWRLQRGLELLRADLDARHGTRSLWSALLLPVAFRHPVDTAVAGAVVTSAVQGAFVMSMGLKIGIAAAGLVLLGAAWWKFEETSAVPLHPEAATLSPAADPPLADSPVEAAPEEARREVAPIAPPAAEHAEAPAAPAPAAAPTLEPGSIDVRFVDANGAPWPDVRVDCLGDASNATASSGPDGRVELSSSLWAESRGRRIDLRARHERCAMVILHAVVHAAESTHLGDVVLAPGVTLSGRVHDPEGRGIEGAHVGVATVELESRPGEVSDEERMHRHGSEAFGNEAFTESGPNGNFAIEGVAPGKWRLWGHAEDMRFAWTDAFEVTSGTDVQGLDLVIEPLRPTDKIEGRVLDPSGAPVPRAPLSFLYRGENESGVSGSSCDAEGRFEALVFVDGVYWVIASDPESRFSESGAFELHPGDLDVVLRLTEKRFVEVQAKDPTGTRVSDVALQILELEESWSRAVAAPEAAEEDTRFDPPGFPFLLVVSAPGYRKHRPGPLDPNSLGTVLPVEMEHLPRITGIVRAEGQALAGVRVELIAEREEGALVKNGFPLRMDTERASQGKTSADGSFALDVDLDVSSQIFVRVVPKDGHFATLELGPVSVAGATSGALALELTPGGTLEGRVLLPDGRDGEGVIVGINCGDGDAVTLRAGPGGVYRFEHLRPGKWQVTRRENELYAGSTTITSNSTGTSIEWTCEVYDGRTTKHDLVLGE
jgi:RNA polymerase sigma-70 factor (ECF subfamily)